MKIIDTNKVVICRQSLAEMKKVYETMLCRHFPADEVKPFRYVERWYQEGRYMGYGLYQMDESGNPVGTCLAYAWLCCMKAEKWALLDYYAVEESLRGQGTGSWFLKQILENYTDGMPVIIEVENPDELDEFDEAQKAQEKAKRLRRVAFYVRNGVRETKLSATVFHVPYRIMVYLPKHMIKENAADTEELFELENLKQAYYAFYTHIREHVALGK